MACKRCGRCCRKLFLVHKFEGDIHEAIKNIKMRSRLEVIGRKDIDHLIVSIDTPCKHLIQGPPLPVAGMGGVTAPCSCEIYDQRPEGCRLFTCSECND